MTTSVDVGNAEDWKRIEDALGFAGEDAERRNRLFREFRQIWSLYLGHPWPDVRNSNIAKALAVLHRDAARLYLHFEPDGRRRPPPHVTFEAMLEPQPLVCDPELGLDPELDELDRWARTYLSSGELLPSETRDSLLDGLEALIAGVEKWQQNMPADQGGRSADWRLKGTVIELGRFYHHYSGRQPGISRHPSEHEPSGPFFRLVRGFLQIFAPKMAAALTDEALAKTIQRALKYKDKDLRWVVGG